MVQNWENFMMPDSGNNLGENNALMSGAMGLFFGIGIDWLGVPILNRLEKSSIRLKNVEHYGVRSTINTVNSLKNDVTLSPLEKLKADVQNRASSRGTGIANPEKRAQRRKEILNINRQYDRLKSGTKLIGWGLLGMTAASIVEGLTTPGLSKEAISMDERAMGGATYLDTPQSYTQRQRALMAIHESQLGIRGIISQEASGFHK